MGYFGVEEGEEKRPCIGWWATLTRLELFFSFSVPTTSVDTGPLVIFVSNLLFGKTNNLLGHVLQDDCSALNLHDLF